VRRKGIVFLKRVLDFIVTRGANCAISVQHPLRLFSCNILLYSKNGVCIFLEMSVFLFFIPVRLYPGMIVDDEIFDIIVAPLPSGAKLTAVMDCIVKVCDSRQPMIINIKNELLR